MRLIEHIEKLFYFIAIYEAGSMKKASEKALIGQPQLSRTVKLLEDLLQKELFIRSSQGVKPTLEGDLLYKFSKKMLKQTSDFEYKIRSQSAQLSGTVRVGAYDSISRYFFPEFIKYLKLLAPELEVVLTSARSQSLIHKLENKEIDFAIVAKDNQKSRLTFQKVYSDSFSLFKVPQLQVELSQNLIAFDKIISDIEPIKAKHKLKTVFPCENLETVVSLTLSGLGVGLLPKKVAREYLISGKLESLKSKELYHHDIQLAFHQETKALHLKNFYTELTRFIGIWSRD